MARIWNLRLNLDLFNGAIAALADDGERAQFLAGLSRGANGGAAREDAPRPWLDGFALGASMRAEAEGFHAVKAAAGRASAEARKAASGSAQPVKPRTAPEHCSTNSRTPFDGCSGEPASRDAPVPPVHPPDDASPDPAPRTALEQCSNGVRENLEPIHNLQTKSTKYPPTPQKGGKASSSRKAKKEPGQPTGLMRLFSEAPNPEDAFRWFNLCLDARDEHKVWADGKAHQKSVTSGCPANEPGRDARVFLARVADGYTPRVLHACLRLHLADKRAADNHCCARLQIFFGEVNGLKKATWFGYLKAAEAKVQAAVAAEASPAPPPAPEPAPPPLPVIPDDLLAGLGLPAPVPAGA